MGLFNWLFGTSVTANTDSELKAEQATHVAPVEVVDGRVRVESGGKKVVTVDPETLRILDLRSVPGTRLRIRGSAHWVSDAERQRIDVEEYLLIRGPSNRFDANAVAIYADGRKFGYLSAAKAAALAPILDPLDEEAFLVNGYTSTGAGVVRFIDVPRTPILRDFVQVIQP